MPYDEPLGLPKGSVRAILALLLVISAVIEKYATGSVSGELNTLASAAVAFYFGNRAGNSDKKA